MASVVDLDRQRLAEADEHNQRNQREDVLAGAEQEPEHAGADPDEGDEADEECEPGGKREEPGPMDSVRPRMAPFLRRDQLDRGRQRFEVISGFRHRD